MRLPDSGAMPKNTSATLDFPAPALGLLVTEPLRALLDFLSAKVGPVPAGQGDGHPVIVYPGLGAGAVTTHALRKHLRECGFAADDWGFGVNTGPDGTPDEWFAMLADRVRELHAATGRRVSLVGWSLGGVYAREVAKLAPGSVRQVITLATPFGALGDGNHASTVYRLLGGDTSHLTPEMQAQLREAPPVPTTSIYSKSDGVVSWQACLQADGTQVQNLEVNASHLGIVTHPRVLAMVQDRLMLPDGLWRPYRAQRTLSAPATARGRSRTSPAR
jgi:thioesterase domain-containing protein